MDDKSKETYDDDDDDGLSVFDCDSQKNWRLEPLECIVLRSRRKRENEAVRYRGR